MAEKRREPLAELALRDDGVAIAVRAERRRRIVDVQKPQT
jgi:hypothetical protein